MKKILTILIILSYCTITLGQVIIGTYPKIVPNGKKWVLSSKMSPLIQLNESALYSGNYCNAQIQSNPRIITGIIEGNYGYPNKLYNIDFNELTKIAYTNELTYKLSSINSIICYDYNEKNESKSTIKKNDIVFFPGQSIYVSGCINSIELTEILMTQKEIDQIKKSEILKEQAELLQKKQREIDLKKTKLETERIQKTFLYLKIKENKVFKEYELINSVNPKIILTDTTNFIKIFTECLFDEKYGKDMYCTISFDTSLNIINWELESTAHSYIKNNNFKENPTSKCNKQDVISELQKYLKLSENAKILVDGKYIPVSISKSIYIKSKEKISWTKQNVYIKRKKGNIIIEMTKSIQYNGNEYELINEYPFMNFDKSYEDKIKEYIINNPPNTAGYHSGIPYFAKKNTSTISIYYDDNLKDAKQIFSISKWKIIAPDFIGNINKE